jgi:hypothetical protein
MIVAPYIAAFGEIIATVCDTICRMMAMLELFIYRHEFHDEKKGSYPS